MHHRHSCRPLIPDSHFPFLLGCIFCSDDREIEIGNIFENHAPRAYGIEQYTRRERRFGRITRFEWFHREWEADQTRVESGTAKTNATRRQQWATNAEFTRAGQFILLWLVKPSLYVCLWKIIHTFYETFEALVLWFYEESLGSDQHKYLMGSSIHYPILCFDIDHSNSIT